MLLSDVKVITLHKNEYARGRRVSPIPQMQCVGGSAQGRHEFYPTTVQCQQVAHSGQWKCEAELDQSVKFGKISVSCEGYDYPEDPYVLKESCGLKYELEYTNLGRENQKRSHYPQQQYYSSGHHSSPHYYVDDTAGTAGSILLFVIMIFVFVGVLRACVGSNHVHSPGIGSVPTYGSAQYVPSAPTPGFWSGLTSGGILGYMFARNRNPTVYPNYQSNPYPIHYPKTSPSSSPKSTTTRQSFGYGGTEKR